MQRKFLVSTVTFLFILLFQQATAQEKEEEYLSLYKKIADTTSHSFDPARPYYLGIWEKDIPRTIKIIRRLSERAAIFELQNEHDADSLRNQARIAPATDEWKYSPFAARAIEEKSNETLSFNLSCPDHSAWESLIKNSKVAKKIISVDERSHSIVISAASTYVKENLLILKEVIFIDLRAEPHAEISIIGYNRSFHGVNAVDYSIPGANGKNIVAGVKEQTMEEADLDLYKRVLASSISSPNITNHATVISSIIGGAGNSFYDGRGIAYGCRFFPSSFTNLFADDAAMLDVNKVSVQNHSYGTVIQQFYGAEAASYDAQAWQHKNFVAVFSSGNSGTGTAPDGPYKNIPGFANLTGNFKMAKNIITVGAIDNKGNIPGESSSGPLYDGRLAPQLVALGPNGTSDAAAVVSGTVAVMQQVFADSNGQVLPVASLIKAVLYNSADDIYHTGIDYKTGYGLLNSFAAINAIQHKEYDGSALVQGQQWTKTITVPANTAQLKVTLAWTDSASLVNNNRALLNDLDLEVVQLNNSTVYKPWVLSAVPHPDSLANLPLRKRDSLNTAEQVSISSPSAGNYEIKVTGNSIVSSSMAFTIAYHTDTLNTFHFTSPQHTSDVNRDENPELDIRWKTFVADTNQAGNLYVSYDAGSGWQLVKAAQKIYTNYYRWPIKDTSSRAMFRMETSFGDFLSREFVISKLARLNVDFLCSDTFRLSWNKHIYAGSYTIYGLTDSPYLENLVSVTDTFVVLKQPQYPWFVYAVEPVLNNGLPAARSVATDIRQEGVKCFYRTFYYTLLDQNKIDLIVDLSIPAYVDSVFFENVTAGGQFLQSYGRLKVNNDNTIYDQIASDIPAGTSYWRVAIKLKNGNLVYTDIISVLTSGKKYILFYPNPVDRKGTLGYILQQNLPTDSKLQFFDISGRLLRSYAEIPNSIDLLTLAPGLVIYKLFSRDKQLLETGKLLLR